MRVPTRSWRDSTDCPQWEHYFGLSLPSQYGQKALVKKVVLFQRLEDIGVTFYLVKSLKPGHGDLITSLLKLFFLSLVHPSFFFLLLSSVQWLLREKNQPIDPSFLSQDLPYKLGIAQIQETLSCSFFWPSVKFSITYNREKKHYSCYSSY